MTLKRTYASKWPWSFCLLSFMISVPLVTGISTHSRGYAVFKKEKQYNKRRTVFRAYLSKCQWDKLQATWSLGSLQGKRKLRLKEGDSGQPKEEKGKGILFILGSWGWTGRPSWFHGMRILGCFHLIQSLSLIQIGIDRVKVETENTVKTLHIIQLIQVQMIYYFVT